MLACEIPAECVAAVFRDAVGIIGDFPCTYTIHMLAASSCSSILLFLRSECLSAACTLVYADGPGDGRLEAFLSISKWVSGSSRPSWMVRTTLGSSPSLCLCTCVASIMFFARSMQNIYLLIHLCHGFNSHSRPPHSWTFPLRAPTMNFMHLTIYCQHRSSKHSICHLHRAEPTADICILL